MTTALAVPVPSDRVASSLCVRWGQEGAVGNMQEGRDWGRWSILDGSAEGS